MSESDVIRIGVQGAQTSAYMAGIYGTALPSNSPVVVVESSGQLGAAATISAGNLPGGGVITVNTGAGLSGGATVVLGGALTLY